VSRSGPCSATMWTTWSAAGSPPGTAGKTNLIRVHKLGEDAR